MCNCHSYNKDTGTKKEVIITNRFTGHKISIDDCISYLINHLNLVGIETIGSCCGHNKKKPSIVLANKNEINICKSLISKLDHREFNII